MNTAVSDKLEEFFARFKHQTYKKGELLIRADDEPGGVFYLKDGTVKKYAISRKGEEIVVNLFKPVSFFPMSWALNDSQNDYFYEAMSTVEIWKAPKEKVVEFIKNEPDVLYDLMCRVYRGTDGMLMRMVYLMAGNAYNRLIAELLIYAKRFAKGKNKITLEISEKDIASFSGMTRETVSREMKILKEKGLILTDNHKLTITDVHKLEVEIAESV